jgi:alpha-amylase
MLAELRALVDAAHARDMKVYFDIITNHTADVIGYQEGARTAYVPKDKEPYRTAASPFDDRDYAGHWQVPAARPSPSPTHPRSTPVSRTSKCRAG